jgi:hypothetical protein
MDGIISASSDLIARTSGLRKLDGPPTPHDAARGREVSEKRLGPNRARCYCRVNYRKDQG